jgi:hypothetical protein
MILFLIYKVNFVDEKFNLGQIEVKLRVQYAVLNHAGSKSKSGYKINDEAGLPEDPKRKSFWIHNTRKNSRKNPVKRGLLEI